MQDLTEMRWVLDFFTERRINDRIMDAADRYGAVLLERELSILQPGQSINSAYIARTSLEMAKASVDLYIEENLI